MGFFKVKFEIFFGKNVFICFFFDLLFTFFILFLLFLFTFVHLLTCFPMIDKECNWFVFLVLLKSEVGQVSVRFWHYGQNNSFLGLFRILDTLICLLDWHILHTVPVGYICISEVIWESRTTDLILTHKDSTLIYQLHFRLIDSDCFISAIHVPWRIFSQILRKISL